MKYEIIYTDDYALIVSDEFIEEGDFGLNVSIKNLVRYDGIKGLNSYYKKIMAHRPLLDSPILEGVVLLPGFEFSERREIENSLDRILDRDENGYSMIEHRSYEVGYRESKKTYKYTEDDLRKAFTAGLMNRYSRTGEAVAEKEFIQSLQQPKRPKYFECVIESNYKHIGAVKGVYGSGFRIKNEKSGMPKTATNSQGQTELVGSYIF
jgi:hypothetical protein